MSTAALDIKIDSRDVPNATRELDRMAKSGASVEKSVGSMKGAMQNVSWQLQDIAVQAQMGTSALTILAQQGPQIASAFGPAGAAAGAVIGIGALIASLASSGDVATESLDDMVKKMDELGNAQLANTLDRLNEKLHEQQQTAEDARVKYEQVAASQERSGLTAGMYAVRLTELKAAHEKAADGVYVLVKQVEDVQSRMDGSTKSMEDNARAASDLISAYKFANSIVGEAAYKQNALTQLRMAGIDATSEEGKAVLVAAEITNKAVEAQDALEKAHAKSIATAAKSAQEAERQAALDVKRRESQLQSANAWLERVNQLGATEVEQVGYWKDQELAKLAEFEKAKAILPLEANTARIALEEEAGRRRIEIEENVLKKALEATRLRTSAEQQAISQMSAMQWGLASQSLDAISMAAEEGSTMQKAAFVAGKGMAAAQAVMQAELAGVSTMAAYAAAAAAAGAGGPALLAAGVSQAAAMKTMGYASAAVIAAQGFAGMFDNGGSIGSKEWGIVGENGPEIVKGPVNVTSRKKTAALAASAMGGDGGGGMVVNITQNITGNGDEALAKVIQKATKAAVDEVHRDAATNGRIRKTLGV
ncbi:MAG: phage tail length tape measure family protein [Shewanella sp.]|uniref:phage tail length tape measure family protein n=1 Tax=Aeromonas popoffii TaxID=70856 RepID=UPI003F367AFC